VIGLTKSFDLREFEEIVERAIRRARSEELRLVGEAVKKLAEYMETGFKATIERIEKIEERIEKIEERIEEHSKILKEHSKRLEELSRVVGELKVAIGSIGRRWGRDLEKTVIELYKHLLVERGITPERIEKFIYRDLEGKYHVKGSTIEFDIYIHDDKVYLIEVKSHAEIDHVEWFYKRAEIYEKITSRKPYKLVLIAVNIDEDAYTRARELGIDVICGSIIY